MTALRWFWFIILCGFAVVFTMPQSWFDAAAPALRTIGLIALVLGTVAAALAVLHAVATSVDTAEHVADPDRLSYRTDDEH